MYFKNLFIFSCKLGNSPGSYWRFQEGPRTDQPLYDSRYEQFSTHTPGYWFSAILVIWTNSFLCNHGNLTNKGYFKGVWSCFEMLIFLFLFFHIWFVLFFYNRFLFFYIWFVLKSKIFCNGQKSFWCQLSTRETYSG